MVVNQQTVEQGLEYIRKHPEIRDVILSGGDPLLLADDRLEWILKRVRAIPTVDIIRIGTRIPVVLPQRITPTLVRILRRHHPLYINTHFNHPAEITELSSRACARLADAGIPLGNQTVLLRGVNDDPAVMKSLMQKLLSIRVKPYYIYQADMVQGTEPLPHHGRGGNRNHPCPARPHLRHGGSGLRHRRSRRRRKDPDPARLPAKPWRPGHPQKLPRGFLHLRQCLGKSGG